MSTDEDENPTEEIIPRVWNPKQTVFFGPTSRSILISGTISQEVSDAVVSQLLELNAIDPKEPITLYLNTLGGDVISALAIYDMLQIIQAPIITIVNGACYSCGLVLLAAGGMRLATPLSTFHYHQVVMNPPQMLSHTMFDSTGEFYQLLQRRIDKILLERSGMDKDEWEQHFAGNMSKHFTAEQAVEYSFLDDLIEYSSKPELKKEEEEWPSQEEAQD